MRITVPLLCLALLVIGCAWWLTQRNVNTDAARAAEHAQSLENALQGVEWYTNESVNKALHAEADGDLANARLFGDKAIESDLKAQGLRSDTAAAWRAAGQPERARAAWKRAAEMAAARAKMLADRIPPLQKQWAATKAANTSAVHEASILYLQSLMYTAEQWALVVQFASDAGETDQTQAGAKALRALLLSMQQTGLLEQLANEPRLAGSIEKYHRWQQTLAAVH